MLLMLKKPEEAKGTRINKYLADKGICTRRGADELISSGKILIGGRKAVLGDRVLPGDDVKILERIDESKYLYYAYYKPRGVITHSPSEGETDILTASGLKGKGVFPIGRLDKDSEGLIILSNDGRITKRLLGPEFEHEKEYVVKTKSPVAQGQLLAMEKGMRIEGGRTRPCKTKLESTHSFKIILTEGKKRQIRRMCKELGIKIASLRRVRIMNIKLVGLEENGYRELEGRELETFKRSLGL
jgi:23S rRNA pseudouridine2604 synthase